MQKNAEEAIEEFKKEYWRDIEDVARQECKEGIFRRENCQEGLWQESYLNSWTRGMIKNIGEDWREIGDSGKKND